MKMHPKDKKLLAWLVAVLGPCAFAGGIGAGALGADSGLQTHSAASYIAPVTQSTSATPTPVPTLSAPPQSKPAPTRVVYVPRTVVKTSPPIVIVLPPTTTPEPTPSETPTETPSPSESATPSTSPHAQP